MRMQPPRTLLACLLIAAAQLLPALTVGTELRVANLAFARDRVEGDASFAGDTYPWSLSITGHQRLADQLTVDAGFFADPILRNVSYTLFNYQESLFTMTVGPFFGLLNGPGTLLKSGLATGVRLELPGVAFLSFRSDSTIGGRLVEAGDYLQERSDLAAGFWVHNAIASFTLRSREFTQRATGGSDVVDGLTEYEFATRVFQKNVPYQVEVAFAYQVLSKSFIGASTTTTHTLNSLILGTTFATTINDFIGLSIDLESSVYTFGSDVLLGISNPGPLGYLFRVTTAVTVDIDRVPGRPEAVSLRTGN